jgi:hypothetical protein
VLHYNNQQRRLERQIEITRLKFKTSKQFFLHSLWKTPLLRLDEGSDGCEEAALVFDEVPAAELLIVVG